MKSTLLAFLSIALLTCAGWAQEGPVLRIEDARGQAGQAVALDLVLERAPAGLQQYVFVVELDSPEVAVLDAVEGVALSGNAFQVSSATEARAEFRALDLNNDVTPGAEGVVLARLTLAARAEGATPVRLTVRAYVDDSGAKVEPEVQNGVFTVGGGTPQPSEPSPPAEPAAEPRNAPRPVGGSENAPRDPDGDGLYEDVNGDGRLTSDDAGLLLSNLNAADVQADARFFDFDGDGQLTNADVSRLLTLIQRAAEPAAPAEPAQPTPEPPALRVGSARANADETASLPITLTRAPQGLERFTLRVRLAPAGVARIAGVQSVALPADFVEVVSQSDTELVFRGADFDGAIQPGAGEVTLARLQLQGIGAGTVRVELEAELFVGDGGAALQPQLSGGQVAFVRGPAALGPGFDPPRDLDGDGLFEDVNGDGVFDSRDPLTLAFNLDNPAVREGAAFFDFNGDGRVSFADAVALAGRV